MSPCNNQHHHDTVQHRCSEISVYWTYNHSPQCSFLSSSSYKLAPAHNSGQCILVCTDICNPFDLFSDNFLSLPFCTCEHYSQSSSSSCLFLSSLMFLALSTPIHPPFQYGHCWYASRHTFSGSQTVLFHASVQFVENPFACY